MPGPTIDVMPEAQIFLNGETRTVPDALSIDRLLEFFSLPKQRIAIELNNAVVRRIDWPQTVVRDGDKIEVVHFVGGG
jgi:sulfur carrier protein